MKQNIFNSVQMFKPKSNVFDLSHDVKMSCNMGQLIPILNLECVPGDRFNISAESLIRLAPLVSPMMHRVDATIHYFFVPNRILWPSWEQFITSPNSDEAPPFPYFDIDGGDAPAKSLADYLGIPDSTSSYNLSALPFAAYNKIYQDYYRDQNLIPTQDSLPLIDGDNTASFADFSAIKRRAWEHDYFTASLPFAQKGEAVSIPLGDVNITDAVVRLDTTTGPPNVITGSLGNIAVPRTPSENTDVPADALYANTGGNYPVDPTTINDLRQAFRLQEWLEKNARAGTRYVENILAHFGVRSSDKRMQRPEYITGVKTPITISEVLNTAGEFDSIGGVPQGTMSGHGVAVVNGGRSSYFCEEHGIIMGIMSVIPRTAYFQGIHRQWVKFDPLDYYWPSFAHLGEQAVLNKEIYADTPDPDGTFGYVPRYAEYKYMPSRVAGEFKTNLDFWHMARKFDTVPALNQTFVECNPTMRTFAVTDTNTDHLYIHVLNKIRATRPMPKFGTPSL